MVHDIAFDECFLADFIGVDLQMELVIVLDVVRCCLGQIAGDFRFHGAVNYDVETEFHRQVHILPKGHDFIIGPVDLFLHAGPACEDGKMVVGKAGNEGIGESVFQYESCFLQKFIAPAAAVEKVEHPEIADIHVQHDLPFGFPGKGKEEGRLLEEAGLPRKARNAVNVVKHIPGAAVQEEHIKHRPNAGHLKTMAELFHRLHRPVLRDDTVIHVVEHIGAGGNLALNILLHLFRIAGMDKALESAAGDCHEIVHIKTAQRMDQPGIGIKNFLCLISSVNKDAAGHTVHGVLQNGCIGQ